MGDAFSSIPLPPRLGRVDFHMAAVKYLADSKVRLSVDKGLIVTGQVSRNFHLIIN